MTQLLKWNIFVALTVALCLGLLLTLSHQLALTNLDLRRDFGKNPYSVSVFCQNPKEKL
jgi:hypothetical protein